MLDIPSGFEEIMQIKVQLHEARVLYWHVAVLFSFQWWLSISVPLFFIWAWYKLCRRSQLVETALYGLFWAAAATYLDTLGTSFLLWEYPYTILPYGSKHLSVNLTSLPIALMLVYQYCPSWPAFARGTVAISLVFAFVLEPLLVWLGIYIMYHWTYWYSFIIYILLSFLFRWAAKKIIAIQSGHKFKP